MNLIIRLHFLLSSSPIVWMITYVMSFYFLTESLSNEEVVVSRQAYAGLLWSKQFYYYVIEEWLKGDPSMPCPPNDRLKGRNAEWKYLHNKDIISMPDKWEYPWVCKELSGPDCLKEF